VGAGSFEDQVVGVDTVDEQPIWGDVALAVLVPLAAEAVVPVLGWQRLAARQHLNDGS
jgi:hypothetical protein